MKIQISGHHVAITDAINSSVESKFEKVSNHYPDLADLSVIIKVDKHEHSVEANTQFQGISISVTSTDAKDMYSAIQSAAKKLEASLSKRKGSLLAGRNDKLKEEPATTEAEIEDEYLED